MDRRTKRWVVAGIALAATLIVWFGASETGDTVVVPAEQTPSRDPVSNRFSQIEPASRQQIQQVRRFLNAGAQLREARVLASWREERSYYFAAKVYSARGKGRLGMWLVGGTKTNPGMVLSVNATAESASSAPWGPDPESGIYDTETDILADYYN